LVEEVPPVVEIETTYNIIAIKKKQIDFPYFVKVVAEYKPKLALLRVKLGQENYALYNGRINKYFNSLSESAFIQRRTPKYEMVLPYHIEEKRGEETINHLMILGAEVKAKPLGMGYSSKVGSGNKSYTAFFVYGCEQEVPDYGTPTDTRKGRGIDFIEYAFANPEVQKKALELFQLIIENK